MHLGLPALPWRCLPVPWRATASQSRILFRATLEFEDPAFGETPWKAVDYCAHAGLCGINPPPPTPFSMESPWPSRGKCLFRAAWSGEKPSLGPPGSFYRYFIPGKTSITTTYRKSMAAPSYARWRSILKVQGAGRDFTRTGRQPTRSSALRSPGRSACRAASWPAPASSSAPGSSYRGGSCPG